MPKLVPAHLNSDAAKQAVIDSLAMEKKRARYWARRAGEVVAEGGSAPDPVQTRVRVKVKQHVAPKYGRARANNAKLSVLRIVEPLPMREQALALDAAIRKSPPAVRTAMSLLPACRQEQFIGARVALERQVQLGYTVDASVDCRLEVPLSFEKLAMCNTFLSRKRRPDGSLQRIVVMPIPTPVHEARKRGIHTPLCVQPPFRPAQQIRDRQAALIVHDDIEVSADGKALDIGLAGLAAETLAAARLRDNYRQPPAPRKPRLQYMFDAYRYMRGKGATRFGVRPMDLAHSMSSLLYWRDCCFYAGNDKYHSIALYCARAIATLNNGARVDLIWEGGKIVGATSHIRRSRARPPDI